ncbi:hypothetical protein [Brevibacillus panacihumi]|uniref:hypothetical protein n=1 Tax=Brevibacillus panacihumi TaxID=497735 RepID=UPI003D19A17E
MEDKWLEQLKERADQGMLRDVHFTADLENGVRDRIHKRTPRMSFMRFGPVTVAALLLVITLWQVWPQQVEWGQSGTDPVQQPPSLLPGGVLQSPELWKPSPVVEGTVDNLTFSYLGEKPVRLITDESNIYAGQQQKFMWMLDGDFSKTVDIVAHDSEGQQVELGSFEVGGGLYDAKGHFPSGLVLPTPGIWKLEVRSSGKYFGHVFIEVKSGISPSNQSLVEPLIRKFLETEGDKLGWLGKNRQITIELLHVDAPSAEKRRAYAWIRVQSENNSSGISAAMAFDVMYVGNDYRVVGFQMPEDGNRYQSSLAEIFPPEVLDMIRQRSDSPS